MHRLLNNHVVGRVPTKKGSMRQAAHKLCSPESLGRRRSGAGWQGWYLGTSLGVENKVEIRLVSGCLSWVPITAGQRYCSRPAMRLGVAQ